MKKISCAFLLLAVAFIANAQQGASTDSIRYYEKELGKISKEYRDSMRHDERFQSAITRMSQLKAKSDNYSGMALYTQMSSADFDKLNADIKQAGFAPLSGSMWGIGYGFTFKKNRRIFDLNLTVFGLAKKSTNNGETIKTSFSTMFEFNWGYDVIKSNRINLYPYAGFGLRATQLEYKANVQTNPAFSSITNIVSNDRSVNDDQIQIGYQAGVGLEIVLSSPQRAGGTLFFIKAGTNRAFSSKSFNLQGVSYNPEMEIGNIVGAVGFKFFGR